MKEEIAEEKKEEMREEVKKEDMKTMAIAKCKKFCKLDQKNKYVIGAVILVLIVAFAVYSKNNNFLGSMFPKTITKEAAKAKFQDFVTKNVPVGTKFEVKDATEENGLYKIPVVISGQPEIDSYMTKDGMKLFPQAIDLAAAEAAASADSAASDTADQAAAKEVPKSAKPVVKLFVMSYCPYGTQMEKGILPVLKTLGSKIDYTLEFVNYSMHGDKEIAENLTQYCIEKNEPAKLSNYLTCFLKKGEGTSDACMQTALVNTAKVNSCVAETDAKFSVKADAADKSKWSNGTYPPFNVNADDNQTYGVQGSPTLVINGVEASVAGRDSASILKTICSAFTTPPAECKATLSTTAPAPGFGDTTAAAGTTDPNASCATN